MKKSAITKKLIDKVIKAKSFAPSYNTKAMFLHDQKANLLKSKLNLRAAETAQKSKPFDIVTAAQTKHNKVVSDTK